MIPVVVVTRVVRNTCEEAIPSRPYCRSSPSTTPFRGGYGQEVRIGRMRLLSGHDGICDGRLERETVVSVKWVFNDNKYVANVRL